MLLAVGLLGAQAQGTEDLDAKYTKGLLPVGTTAPDFVIKKAKENQPALSLSDYRTHQEGSLQRPGCYVLLDFWATWCPDCRKEIPTVKEIYKNYKNKVKLIGVSFDTDKDKLKEFRNSNEIKWTMYCEGKKWKETNISKAYNIQWIPTMYLIDPEGKVAYTTVVAENMVKKLAELDAAGKLAEYMKKPEFPGGMKAWTKAMDESLSYPEIASKYQAEAKIKISFQIDKEGNTHSDTYRVYYDYYICTVTLENFNLSHLPVYIMGEETLSRYALYMATLGNRPDLFPSSPYVGKYTNKPPAHEIPEDYLADETFAAILKEAEKYVGYPYVWGGSSPSTSFDCSGFVSYVYNQCGWDFGRLGAQGLYNISTRTSSPKPGDLVFFTGTYDTPGISHVGIYVGNGWMLHCGDPISYANLNTSYWQSHFYAYGKLF